MLCFNMQRKAIQVECGEQSTSHPALPAQRSLLIGLDWLLAEDTVDMLCFNMQRKAIQVECGEQSVAVQARPGQGLRDMGIHHPINTRGHPVSFARDFVMLTGTTAQDPVRCERLCAGPDLPVLQVDQVQQISRAFSLGAAGDGAACCIADAPA